MFAYNRSISLIEGDKLKTIAKPIDVVAWVDKAGIIHPIRFKIEKEDHIEAVVKVDRVISIDKEKLGGNEMLIFRCQSEINNVNRLFELKYENRTCKWILWKI